MNPRRTLPIVAGLAAVAAVVALAACGSGSASSGAPSTTASTSATPTASARAGSTTAAAPTPGRFAPGRQVASFDVGGTPRTAIVVVPEGVSDRAAGPVPLVFVFHGHGGRGAGIERTLGIERQWPQAIVVYPDGLPGHQGITDHAGVKPGWQTRVGELGDRDLAFFDTMLTALEQDLPVDRDRISVVGHSNGSAFTSLLLHERGDAIAGTANLSAQPGRLLLTDPVRSMFMAMGEQDPIVSFANQRLSIPLAEQHLGVDPSTAKVDGLLRTARGTDGVELATYVYPGGHAPPPEVAPLIVDFLRRQSLP